MASAVAELEAGLQAMLNLKPPGVSGSRITSLTSLCVANVQSESVLIQKIYTHFKKAPGTHKLGVLYVVDSVTRKWLEQAKHQGQAINSNAQDGTFAAGVHRVTELMPVLMNDILQSAPSEQKDKIKKLIDIWEKATTFPVPMLDSFKEKLSASTQTQSKTSTTPPGSPPPNVLASLQNPSRPTDKAANGSSILEALANMAKQNTASSTVSSTNLPAPASSFNMNASSVSQLINSVQSQQTHQQAPQPSSGSYPPPPQPVNVSSLPFSVSQFPAQGVPPSTTPSNAGNILSALTGGSQGSAGSGLDPNMQQQVLLIKTLIDQGVPLDKIPALIQGLSSGALGGAPPAQALAPPAVGFAPPQQQPWQVPTSHIEPHSRGYQDGLKSPPRYNRRSRSKSPDRGWNSRDSPRNGRDRPDFSRNSPSRGRDDDRNGRRGVDYRQRSPPGHRGRSPDPSDGEFPRIERWIEFDPNLKEGHIRVYSRTLFVGGVTCSEAELRSIFSRFGIVQTCIVNKEKRHAFVKMLTRKDSVRAKEGMEDTRSLELPLRTRWGVGFGPRDCSDYSTGISVIPIHKLTDADRKWMLNAPYGGSGGRPIESGLCVEEPDIEIGAGVSSKAISRRMQTDRGGSHGPKSSRGPADEGSRWSGGRGREDEEGYGGGSGGGQGGTDFPYGIGTLPNGMPNFPTGFSFPDPKQAAAKWS